MKKFNAIQVLAMVALGFSALLISCGSAETKVNPEDKKTPDTSLQIDNTQRPPEEKVPVDKGPAAKTNSAKPGNEEILAHIDEYVVSTPRLPAPPPSGGVNNATIEVKNTLPDATIQKAVIEVSILMSDGAEFRTDYYIVQNLEPGETKTVKVANAARGNRLVAHVVKLKSQELTSGELVTVGRQFSGK